MNKETLRMQMLAGLITESQYQQKLEELHIISLKEAAVENKLVAAQLRSMFEVELIDGNKFPNLDSYIKFEATYKKFPNRKTLTNIIGEQILQCYKGTALEHFNQKTNYQPSLEVIKGGGYEATVGCVDLVKGKYGEDWIYPPLFIQWALNPNEYTIDNLDNIANSPFFKQLTPDEGNDDSSKKIGDEINFSKKTTLVDNPEELDGIIKSSMITFIPFIVGSRYDLIDPLDAGVMTFSKLKDYFNDVGLDYINLLK
jgi:hypothetical protein